MLRNNVIAEMMLEDFSKCEKTFSYKGRNFTDCTTYGWTEDSIHEFGNTPWCYTDNSRELWKMCSDKCEPKHMRTNSSCPDSSYEKYHEKYKRNQRVMYRYYENQLSNCSLESGFGGRKWCPIILDQKEKAICLKTC